MTDSPQEVSNDRMPCKPSTKLRYSDFVAGLGLRATYDDALNLVLDVLKEAGESDFEAGRRLTDLFRKKLDEDVNKERATEAFPVTQSALSVTHLT